MSTTEPLSLRERFFQLLEGNHQGRILFFPDITDWYKARRTPPGEPQRFETGQIIYDDDPFHRQNRDMPRQYQDWTLLDFYRNLGWGCPIHCYEWYDREPDGYQLQVDYKDGKESAIITTPIGEVRQIRKQAADGSFCITEHFAKKTEDLKILCWATRHTSIRVRHDRIGKALDALDGFGAIDITIGRSPFAQFIHDAMGVINGVYALQDDTKAVESYIDGLMEPFMDRIRAAAQTQARLVIISDHADENLISPPLYEKYCLPVYRQACRILHDAGKYVSTHVDGNLKGHFPLLPQTGFDLLDGCTPAPMSNYTVSELGSALVNNLYAYCGIPSSLFTMNLPGGEIMQWALEIERVSDGRMILNVGDVLSPEGDIEQVVRIGDWIKEE